jgi:hemoglobin
MADISSRKDIEVLINTFYTNLLTIDEMKPAFEGLDFEKHTPNIVSFWSFVLLDEEGYKTNVFDKNVHLAIQLHHFDIWLNTFTATIDDLFKGEVADLAKQRATVLTFTFKSKWAQIKSK